MEEFLREYYSFANKAVEVIAALTAIFVLRKYKNTSVKYFCWFLVYVFLIELIGGYTVYVAKFPFLSNIRDALKGTLFERNYWWYAIFWTIGSVVFYTSYFQMIVQDEKFKTALKWCRNLFLIFSIIFLALDFKALFNSTLMPVSILGSGVILICTVLYFLDILKSDKLLTFYKSVNFYVAAVIFIWFLVITPLDFYDILYFSVKDWDYVILQGVIKLSMNIFMYLTFTFALLCCKPQNV